VDSLPTSHNENEEVDSDSESIPDEDHDELWRAEWMEEARRQPNQPVELDFKNLGGQDIYLQYDWIEKSPDQILVSTAAKWPAEKRSHTMMVFKNCLKFIAC
jgi:hypothetical protein